MKWQLHIDGFITKVERPMQTIPIEDLVRCRSGITKKIRNADDGQVARLYKIRDDIDFLINSL